MVDHEESPILQDNPDVRDYTTSKRLGFYIPQRVVMCTFLFLCNIICYVDRVCMAVAIIPMAKEFNWSEKTQGSILSAFYFGYLFTQIVGGVTSRLVGGKLVLYVGICGWSSLTLLMPFAAALATKYWIGILIVARVLLGIFEGVNFPGITHLMSVWVPKRERSRSWAIISAGMDMGTLAALLLCPLITVSMGWEATFYIFGFVGIVWAALFLVLTSATPEDNSFITKYEQNYIAQCIEEERNSTEADKNQENQNVFKFLWQVFKSPAMWAAVIAPVCFSYSNYLLGTYMPKIITSLGVAFEYSGYYSAMPYVFTAGFAILWGTIGDFIINRLQVSVVNSRKIMTVISLVGAPVVWFWLRFSRDSISASTFLLCFASVLTAAHRAGSSISTLDIGGPKYASIIYSISNTFQTIPGIIGPVVTGWILDEIPHVESTYVSTSPWDMIFNIMILVNLFGAVVFVIFAKGTPQFR